MNVNIVKAEKYTKHRNLLNMEPTANRGRITESDLSRQKTGHTVQMMGCLGRP